MSEEECPEAEACSYHHRVDGEYVLAHAKYARLTSYVGEWCVVTDDNLDDMLGDAELEFSSLEELVKYAMEAEAVTPRFETRVYKVGEGSLSEMGEPIDDSHHEFVHYSYKHDNWDLIKDVHLDVVDDVIRDTLDLSRSLMEQEIDALLGS